MSLQEIADSTERYFDVIGREKGKGYKQFQRWKHWAESSLDADGKVIPKSRSAAAYKSFVSQNAYKSAGMTLSFEEMGPMAAVNTSTWSSHIGRLSAIATDLNDEQHILVGSPTGGIWKTTDYGATWTPIFDFETNIDIWSLKISHSNSNHYWVGTAAGVFRSIDAGNTWIASNGVDILQKYNTLKMHPTDPNIIFTIAEATGFIYKSTDGGNNFTLVHDAPSSMYDLEFQPGNPNIVYASGNAGIFLRSTNGGDSFTQISGPFGGGEVVMLAVTPAAPQSVYALQEINGGFRGFYTSTDAGLTWTNQMNNDCQCNNILTYTQTNLGGQAPRDMDVVVSPVNPNEIHIGGTETWKSLDGGVTWTQSTDWVLGSSLPFIHADIDLLIYEGNRLIAGTDGGIFYSTDGADSWTDITQGLGIRQFYRIGAAQTEVDMVAGGSQDNGSGVIRNGVWYDFLGADGMETFIDWSDANTIYGTIQFGYIYKTIDGGQSVTNMSQAGENDGNWITPLEQDPINSNTLYTGKNQIWKSTNGGAGWEMISNFQTNLNADELKIAPSDNQYIYAAYNNTLYRTQNGGTTWTSSSLTGSEVNYINVHPTNPQRLALAISGSDQKIIESFDGGATWTDITNNIPADISIACVLYGNDPNNTMYIGTYPGVFVKDDNSSGSWSPAINGLPLVRVTELEIRNQTLYASTYGRGLWKSDLNFTCDGSVAGQPCNDLDACTDNDVFDADCNCAGVATDADGDGICANKDCDDNDPNVESAGSPCDDGDACTYNDVYDGNCNCTGTPYGDVDNNGVCDGIDSCAEQGTNTIVVNISFDPYSYEISWEIRDETGTAVVIHNNYDRNMEQITEYICLPQGCYDFVMQDSYGDGMCCGYNPNGNYSVEDGQGNVLFSSIADFNSEEINNFCIQTTSCTEGATCDDGDACTTGDVYDANCNCAGTFQDADNDGVCNANDVCPNFDDNLIGTACNDNDACTTNDTYNANCECTGIFQDADNDNICDANDTCPNLNDALIGTPCDDGDPNTTDDTWASDCICTGTPSSGGCTITTISSGGTVESSNGSQSCTTFNLGDEYQDVSFSLSNVNARVNGKPASRYIDLVTVQYISGGSTQTHATYTSNATVDIAGLITAVIVCIEDNDGSLGASVRAQVSDITSCVDDGGGGNPPDCTVGGTCDDGDACTTGDIYDANCNCVGTFADADNDGVCNADDVCPNFDDNLIGTACDDGDSNTINDTWGSDCTCTGTPDGGGGCITYNNESFETDWGIWNDGGGDVSSDALNANTGTYSVRLRDNSGQQSSIYTDVLDLSNYTSLDISFSFFASSMETGEDFLLEMSTNGGSTYNVVQSWVSGTHFTNGTRYNETVTVDGFSNSTVFRIRCDASANNDRVYIDDVVIEDCGGAQKQETIIQEVGIYPNPAQSQINVDLSAVANTLDSENLNVTIFAMNGKRLYQSDMQVTDILQLNIKELPDSQIYLLHIHTNDGRMFRGKFLKF